jgi:hypothetical protein
VSHTTELPITNYQSPITNKHMPFLCLRIDLDYVPWDSPDAAEFGHGEPAMFLKLLDLARSSGHRFQFFVSNRVLRAFPATAEAVLNEGHDLDWFSKHPEEQGDRHREALELFNAIGHQPLGLCTRATWPEGVPAPEGMTFLSSPPGNIPAGIKHFPVDTKADRDAIRSGITARAWGDGIKAQLRDMASRNRSLTVCVRPQVLAKYDSRLAQIKEVLDLSRAVGLPLRTLRQEAGGE